MGFAMHTVLGTQENRHYFEFEQRKVIRVLSKGFHIEFKNTLRKLKSRQILINIYEVPQKTKEI